MSQNNVDYSQNPTGAELMDDYLAAVLANALTTNSGIQRPVYAKAGTFWVDTSVTPWLLKMYNGTKDVLFGEIGTDANGNFTDVNAANLDLNNITNSAINRIRGIAGKPYNIGQIYQSTIPLTDAGLHLLDGTVLVGNGIYKDFVDYIADLYNAGTATDSFLTEVEWQAEVTNKGICGKYVYDSANNTVRLPLFGNKITCSESDLITVGSSESPKTNQIWGTTTDNTTVSFAVSDANLIDGYYYIAVANQTKTDIEVDIDQIAADLANKADTDLSNLTSQGKNIANWSSNITNCITEIPQDIKLELNNGTLTLKAGSKVYVPNGKNADGSNKFDEFITSNDIIDNDFGNASKEVAFLLTKIDSANNFSVWAGIQVVSGTSAPDFSAIDYRGVWYDTSNNIIKIQNGTNEWKTEYGFSLPFCLVSSSSTAVTSIDQVFNGFGYIGSTVFALPGVKGLIPNGRNADGSLKNIEFTTNSVLTYTNPSNAAYSGSFIITNDLSLYASDQIYWKYNQQENLFKHESSFYSICEFSFFECNLGKITSFTPKLPFQAVDRNDSSWIAQQAMPSSTYIDLTIGASGSSYTAPANGYFVLWSSLNSDQYNKYIAIHKLSQSTVGSSFAYEAIVPNAYQIPLAAPVKQDEIIKIEYTIGAAMFRFYYSEGEN